MADTPDPDDIVDAAAANAARGVSSVDADGQKTTALDPLKQLDVADRIAAREAVNSGRTGWGGMLRKAKAIFGGNGPQ